MSYCVEAKSSSCELRDAVKADVSHILLVFCTGSGSLRRANQQQAPANISYTAFKTLWRESNLSRIHHLFPQRVHVQLWFGLVTDVTMELLFHPPDALIAQCCNRHSQSHSQRTPRASTATSSSASTPHTARLGSGGGGDDECAGGGTDVADGGSPAASGRGGGSSWWQPLLIEGVWNTAVLFFLYTLLSTAPSPASSRAVSRGSAGGAGGWEGAASWVGAGAANSRKIRISPKNFSDLEATLRRLALMSTTGCFGMQGIKCWRLLLRRQAFLPAMYSGAPSLHNCSVAVLNRRSIGDSGSSSGAIGELTSPHAANERLQRALTPQSTMEGGVDVSAVATSAAAAAAPSEPHTASVPASALQGFLEACFDCTDAWVVEHPSAGSTLASGVAFYGPGAVSSMPASLLGRHSFLSHGRGLELEGRREGGGGRELDMDDIMGGPRRGDAGGPSTERSAASSFAGAAAGEGGEISDDEEREGDEVGHEGSGFRQRAVGFERAAQKRPARAQEGPSVQINSHALSMLLNLEQLLLDVGGSSSGSSSAGGMGADRGHGDEPGASAAPVRVVAKVKRKVASGNSSASSHGGSAARSSRGGSGAGAGAGAGARVPSGMLQLEELEGRVGGGGRAGGGAGGRPPAAGRKRPSESSSSGRTDGRGHRKAQRGAVDKQPAPQSTPAAPSTRSSAALGGGEVAGVDGETYAALDGDSYGVMEGPALPRSIVRGGGGGTGAEGQGGGSRVGAGKVSPAVKSGLQMLEELESRVSYVGRA